MDTVQDANANRQIVSSSSFQAIGLTISTDTMGDGNLSIALKRWMEMSGYSGFPKSNMHAKSAVESISMRILITPDC